MHGTITPLDHAKSSATYQKLQSEFNTALNRYIETGFLFLTDPKVDQSLEWTERRRLYRQQAPAIPHVITRRLTRQIAKDLKRPVVIAEKSWWNSNYPDGFTKVTIRKSQGRAVLVNSMFFLEEMPPHSWWRPENKGKIATRYDDTRNWYLYFSGLKGHEQLNNWVEHCTTDPACRKALKLDTHP